MSSGLIITWECHIACHDRHMSGSLRPRPDRGPRCWDLRVERGSDPVTGRRRQRTRTFEGTKRAAELALAKLVTDTRKEGGPTTEATLATAMDRWVAHKRQQGREEATLNNYRQQADTVCAEIGDVALDQIRPEHLERFYAGLTKAGRKAATVERYHSAIRGALNLAVRRGWMPANPALGTARPSVKPHDIIVPAPEDVRALVAVAEDHDWALYVFIRTAVGSWARRGEVAALRWCDVQEERGQVLIEASISALDGVKGARKRKDTKSHRKRAVTLDTDLLDLLAAHRAHCEAEAAKCDLELRPDGYVFADPETPDGSKPWDPQRATDGFAAVRKLAGVVGVRLQDLRHFGPTQALANGVPITTVSHRLGHSKVTTTLNIYSHWIPATDHLASDLMGELLRAPAAIEAG